MADAKSGTVLFQSDPDEEYLRIECCELNDGGVQITQRGSGELARWSFDEPSHVLEIRIDPKGAQRLCGYFEAESTSRLVSVLGAQYASCVCIEKIRSLLDWLGIAYVVCESSASS